MEIKPKHTSHITRLINLRRNKESDEIYTPSYVVRPIIPYLQSEKVWLEPATTAGNESTQKIVEVLREGGIKVIESHCDFLSGSDLFSNSIHNLNFDGVVTNPPYSIKDCFIERCYELKKPWAMLMPVTAIQGKKRGNLFSSHLPSPKILAFNERIDFTMKGNPSVGIAWFMWNTKLDDNKWVSLQDYMTDKERQNIRAHVHEFRSRKW